MLTSVSIVSVTTHVSIQKGHSRVLVTQDSFSTETSDLVPVSMERCCCCCCCCCLGFLLVNKAFAHRQTNISIALNEVYCILFRTRLSS